MKTALEYYKDLKKKKKRQPIKLKVFKALEAGEYDNDGVIKRNKTINQVQQLLNEA